MLIVFMLLLLMAGCRHDNMTNQEPESPVALPISILLPSEDAYANSRNASRRVIGDPGTTEHFSFPEHIYFFVLKYDGENWSLWHKEHVEPTENEWIAKRNPGYFQTAGDTIYQYNHSINLLLADQKFAGHVFAIASSEELTFNTPFASITTAAEVRDLKFSTSSSTIQQNLQNIYSTPYNYEVSGAYYGSFSSITQKVPHIDLMLYHVAAKVDIQWNVEDTVRIRSNPSEAVRLTYMEARHLFNGDAYCFKPMENTVVSLPATGYDLTNIVTPTDEGLWWEGRSYFYTIPYTVTGNANYFPLQMRLRTNGSADTYSPTLNLRVDTSSPFVPWLRIRFNFAQPLEDKSETKTIDS